MEVSRRKLITGLISLVAAPAIVKAESLMKIAPTRRLLTPDEIINNMVRTLELSNEYMDAIDFYSGTQWRVMNFIDHKFILNRISLEDYYVKS